MNKRYVINCTFVFDVDANNKKDALKLAWDKNPELMEAVKEIVLNPSFDMKEVVGAMRYE